MSVKVESAGCCTCCTAVVVYFNPPPLFCLLSILVPPPCSHGVVLRDLGRKQEAQAAFLRALRSFPLLAPAWVDLLKLCGGSSSRKSLNAVAPHLPAHWSRPLFTASALVEIQSNAAALVLLRELSGVFPLSTTIQTAVAKALYQARDIQGASTLFAKIRQQDPCLIDGMDCYSNCLYVQGDGPALSGLCRDLIRVDRNRVESCVTAGNFFSLRGSRERAISYFKRALKLDSLTVQQDNGNSGAVASSCWTLLGHEFVEARNTSAAIECYRRGCEASNGRDFRAWFGLGNSYELLRLPSYAAYYYRRACALRPYDPRLWMALGRSYEALERVDAAVACYERGAANDDRTGVSLLRLAKLERSRATAASASAASASDKVKAERYREAAKRHYAAFVALMESNNAAHTSEVAEALLYLAEQALVQNVVVAGGGKRDIEACISFASRVTLMPLAAHAKRARQLLVEAHKLRAEEEAAKGTTKTNTTPSAATGVAAAGGAGGASTAKKQQQDQQQFFLRANPFGRALAGALAAVGISGGGGGGGAAAPNANAASSAAEGGATATAGGVGGPFGGPGAAAGMRATTTLRPHATAGMLKAAKGMGMTQGTTHQAAGKKRMATDDDDNDDDDDDDDGNHDRDALVAEDDGDGDDDDDGFRSAPASSAAAAAAGRPGTAIGARRPAPAPTPTPAGPALNASSGSDGSGMMMEDDDEDEDD